MATTKSIPWDSDRVQQKSSIEVLLDWVTTDGNYERWTKGQIMKRHLCLEIEQSLHAQGIRHRTTATFGIKYGTSIQP